MKKLPVFLLFAFVFSNHAFAGLPVEASDQPLALQEVKTYDQLVHAIRDVRNASQARVEQAVEQEKVREAWETGKLIQEHILLNKARADYGKQVLVKLAADLGTSDTELVIWFNSPRPTQFPRRRGN